MSPLGDDTSSCPHCCCFSLSFAAAPAVVVAAAASATFPAAETAATATTAVAEGAEAATARAATTVAVAAAMEINQGRPALRLQLGTSCRYFLKKKRNRFQRNLIFPNKKRGENKNNRRGLLLESLAGTLAAAVPSPQ